MVPYKQLEQAHDVAYRRYRSSSEAAHRKVFRSSVVRSTSCGKISSSIVTFIVKWRWTLSSRFCSYSSSLAAHSCMSLLRQAKARYGFVKPWNYGANVYVSFTKLDHKGKQANRATRTSNQSSTPAARYFTKERSESAVL